APCVPTLTFSTNDLVAVIRSCCCHPTLLLSSPRKRGPRASPDLTGGLGPRFRGDDNRSPTVSITTLAPPGAAENRPPWYKGGRWRRTRMRRRTSTSPPA